MALARGARPRINIYLQDAARSEARARRKREPAAVRRERRTPIRSAFGPANAHGFAALCGNQKDSPLSHVSGHPRERQVLAIWRPGQLACNCRPADQLSFASTKRWGEKDSLSHSNERDVTPI